MANALYGFEDPAAGRRAAHRLIEEGWTTDAVQLHVHASQPNERLANGADELITGGIVGNMLGLFQGVFEWGSSPHDSADYEETVRQGGAVVSVDARSRESEDIADRLMAAEGCNRHTDWSDAPVRGAQPDRSVTESPERDSH